MRHQDFNCKVLGVNRNLIKKILQKDWKNGYIYRIINNDLYN